MLNTFPELLYLTLLAPFLLRIALGLIVLWFGYAKLFSRSEAQLAAYTKLSLPQPKFWLAFFGTLEVVAGSLLIIGLFTQVTALVMSVVLMIAFVAKLRYEVLFSISIPFLFLLLVVALSLVVTGAGAFAVDLPL